MQKIMSKQMPKCGLIQMLSIIVALKWQSARVLFEYGANKERGVLDRRYIHGKYEGSM